MRGKIKEMNVDEQPYSYVQRSRNTSEKSRLDLNDLLQRAKDQEKSEKKNNLLIVSGITSVAVLFILFLSL